MNVTKVIKQLKEEYPDKAIIQNKDSDGVVTEILCEIEPANLHPDWSNAIAVLDKSTKHYHNETTETYKVLKGTLNLFVDDEKNILNEGDTYTIPPNKVHYATGNETWFECKSEPGWRFEDYIVAETLLETTKLNSPLKSLLWKNDSEDLLVIVGGSGDDRFKMKPLVEKLFEKGLSSDVLTFSFKGVEENDPRPLKQQIKDLEESLEWALEKYEGNIDIACTSMGAYSTSHVLINKTLGSKINSVIFIDPADYRLSKDTEIDGGGTWNGTEEYKPNEETSSNLLSRINSNVKVHVINFLLRNYTKDGYVGVKKRHIDNPDCFARLNNDMVRSFYENTPEKNRGKYIEDSQLPHAFVRDGDIDKNVERLANLIIQTIR